MPQVMNSYLWPESETPEIFVSREILERDGCRGFDGPLHVHAASRTEDVQPHAAQAQGAG